MRIAGKNILIVSPETWGDNYVSKHHYAIALAKKGNNVFFLNPPNKSPLFKRQILEGLHVISHRPKFFGLSRMPKFISALLIKREFFGLEEALSEKMDIIWNFDSSRFFNLRAIPDRVYKICHIVDLNQNIQRSLLASSSNICFGTTRYIIDELIKSNRNSHKVGHGYNHSELRSNDFFFQMPGKNKLKALYMGNLSMKYIDWDVLYESAVMHPGLDFIFVGPDGRSNLGENLFDLTKEKIKELDNVYFQKPVHSKNIPQLLKMADILILAYKEEFHKDQAAPHKIPEYCASGKKILATYTEEYEHESSIFMSKRNKEYPSLFSKVLQEPNESSEFIPVTYEERIFQIEELINV
ncbi:MAG: hypothetical protein JXR03_06835 [Cyclobacteriaceae bacterium]